MKIAPLTTSLRIALVAALVGSGCDENELDEDMADLPASNDDYCQNLDSTLNHCLGIDLDGYYPEPIQATFGICGTTSSVSPTGLKCEKTKLMSFIALSDGNTYKGDWGIISVGTTQAGGRTIDFELTPDSTIQTDDYQKHPYGGCWLVGDSFCDLTPTGNNDCRLDPSTIPDRTTTFAAGFQAPADPMDSESPARILLYGFDTTGTFFAHDPKIAIRTKDAGTKCADNDGVSCSQPAPLPEALQCCPSMPLEEGCGCDASGRLTGGTTTDCYPSS